MRVYQHKIPLHLCIAIILLQFEVTLCCGDLNYVKFDSQSGNITLGWRVRSDNNCEQNSQFDVYVNKCDGESLTLRTPATDDNSGHREVVINHRSCGSKCTVRFQGSNVCTMLLNISMQSKFSSNYITRVHYHYA